MTSNEAPTRVVRLHKRLYPASAVARAIEAAGGGEHQIEWKRAGKTNHHEIVITGPRASALADEIAQTALEETIIAGKKA